MEKKTLSDKISKHGTSILTEDVKKFIKELKKDFLVKEYKDFTELIDKLAGDKLI